MLPARVDRRIVLSGGVCRAGYFGNSQKKFKKELNLFCPKPVFFDKHPHTSALVSSKTLALATLSFESNPRKRLPLATDASCGNIGRRMGRLKEMTDRQSIKACKIGPGRLRAAVPRRHYYQGPASASGHPVAHSKTSSTAGAPRAARVACALRASSHAPTGLPWRTALQKAEATRRVRPRDAPRSITAKTAAEVSTPPPHARRCTAAHEHGKSGAATRSHF